jgi:glycosyltransferase involved in cell wall biosynthesis
VAEPEISVVAATHNRAARLRALLAGLRAQTLAADRFEVVIVDDGSADDTGAVLAEEAAAGVLDLHVIRHASGQGPAAARNAGWRLARAPLIAFIDDDCRPAPRWLEAGLEVWAGDEQRFVQGRTDPDPDEADREGPFTRTLRVRTLGPFFQTCNIFYPRALLERSGGFDGDAFLLPGAEDADLAWRVLDAGAEARFAEEAQAYHAVHELGPVGLLRLAWRWRETAALYARHPARRTVLTYRIFWKKTHYLLVRALIGLLIPRRIRVLRPLRYWCLAPIAPAYLERGRAEGGTVLLAPYYLVYDAVELAAVVRGAVRHRTLIL